MTISLQKGQRISLEKEGGGKLEKVCVGVNWGAIEKKGLFGGTKKEAVDLDASCALFDSNNQLLDTIYYGKLQNDNKSISHSGDDLTGDMDGDDGLDNEIITLDLARVPQNVAKIAVVLNSFRGHDFQTVPFASIRVYEGTPTKVDTVFATFNIASDPKFAGATSLAMARLYRHNDTWKFAAIGETTPDRKLEETVKTVQKNYL